MLVNKQIYYKNSDDVRKHYSPEGMKLLVHDVEPVSYTHLDVYKRQIIVTEKIQKPGINVTNTLQSE